MATGADIIIEPRYSVLRRTVRQRSPSGYANYKNLRMLSSADVQLLKKLKTAERQPENIETYSRTTVETERIQRENKAAESGFVLTLGTASCEDSGDIDCKLGPDGPEIEGTVSAGLSYRRYFHTNFGFSVDADYALLGFEDKAESEFSSSSELSVHHVGLFVLARANYTINKVSLGAGIGFGYSAYLKSLIVKNPGNFSGDDSEELDYSSYQGALGRKLTLTAYYPVSEALSIGLEWSSLIQNESKEEWKGDVSTKPETLSRNQLSG